jgi:hypothetical protein
MIAETRFQIKNGCSWVFWNFALCFIKPQNILYQVVEERGDFPDDTGALIQRVRYTRTEKLCAVFW